LGLKRPKKKYFVWGFATGIGILILFWVGMYSFFLLKKEAIRQQLSAEIGKAIKGQFIVKDLGMNFFNLFPNVSLSMKQVEVRDSAWNRHRQSLLKAQKVLLKIDPFSLLSGNVRISKLVIEDATIDLFSDSSGYTNEYLFTPKSGKATSNKKGFHLEEVALKNVRIIRSDLIKNKLFDFSFRKLKCDLHDDDDNVRLELKLDGIIHSLAFSTKRGSYAKEKSFDGDFSITFVKVVKQLEFDKVLLRIGNQPYTLSGLFDFSEKKNFQITISTNKIIYKEATSVLPARLAAKLNQYDVHTPLDVKASISGKMVFGDLPKVNVDANIPRTIINTPVGDFSDISVAGNFSNAAIDAAPYTDENSVLTFRNVDGRYEGIPVTCKKVTIANLDNPFLRCDLKAETKLASFNSVLSSESFDLIDGDATAEVNYAGALMSDTSTSVNGSVDIRNGSILYEPRNVKLTNIDGKIDFENEDVYVKNLSAEAQGNKVRINAVVKNMLNLLVKDPSKLFVDADINIPSLDLYAFNTMLGSRKKRVVAKKGKFARVADEIDRFMNDCSIATRVHANHVKYKKFIATDLDADFAMNANIWSLHKIVLHNSDGLISMSGTLTSLSDNDNTADVQANVDNVDVSKLFEAFGNFGLSSLHAENLKGNLTCNAQLHAVLDDKSRIIPSSLFGKIDMSLQNGQLSDFEPLQKMAVFVLKKRDFSKVDFAEIKNTFDINGHMITINKMEIQSNVLGLFVEGMYDIKGENTDLVVQVPLKYLKKRDPGYKPENQGLDAKTGISVYVRAKSGDNGDIDFKYGLFKKKSVIEKAERDKEKEMRKATTATY
jgi:hypothetical protein